MNATLISAGHKNKGLFTMSRIHQLSVEDETLKVKMNIIYYVSRARENTFIPSSLVN